MKKKNLLEVLKKMMKEICIISFIAFSLEASFKISNFVIDNGGVEIKAENSNYTLYSTIGEPIIGESEDTSQNKAISHGFGFVSDFTPPRVLSVLPAEKDNIANVKGSIEIKFNENIIYSTTPIKVRGIIDNLGNNIDMPVEGTVEFDTTTKKLILKPKESLKYNHVYEVKLTSGVIFDLEGNPIVDSYSWRFRTILSPDYDNVIEEAEKRTKIYLPAKTLDERGAIDISTVPVRVSGDNIEEANSKLDSYQILGFGPEEVRELNFYDENSNFKDKKFKKGVFVTIKYSDELANQLSKRGIEMYYLNEEKKLWVKIKNFDIDRENKKITAKVYHFSVFGIFKTVNYDLGDVYAYPVPWKPNDGNYNTGTLNEGIRFTNLPDVGKIRIFTITGKLVKELEINEYEEKWDGKNEEGKAVASGVYIYLIENERNKKTGKLMVIR